MKSTIQYYECGKSMPGRNIRGKIIALSTDKLAMFDKNDFDNRGAGYVENPVTIGEKLRNRRLEKLMTREEVAELFVG
ncbi:hypothetical protein [Chitinophaga polysaccharea]|uniref:hypothetical protein n=1 Tax=Chitinophaga polysaccharea TaxID=1293035 RepID=UPI001159ADF2|nr:hypothetical protein [Chitinophaga polysaccharea]